MARKKKPIPLSKIAEKMRELEALHVKFGFKDEHLIAAVPAKVELASMCHQFLTHFRPQVAAIVAYKDDLGRLEFLKHEVDAHRFTDGHWHTGYSLEKAIARAEKNLAKA